MPRPGDVCAHPQYFSQQPIDGTPPATASHGSPGDLFLHALVEQEGLTQAVLK